MEREHALSLAEVAQRGLDGSNGAVAVRERVFEAATESGERRVLRNAGVELAPIGEHLRAAADPGELSSDDEVSWPGLRNGHVRQLDKIRRDELDGARPTLVGRTRPHTSKVTLSVSSRGGLAPAR